MELRVDGCAVFAATGGRPFDAAKPVVVFIHGAGMDHTVWPLQARWFAHHGRSVLAVDLPGHGRSEGKPIGSIEALGAWLGALIAASGNVTTFASATCFASASAALGGVMMSAVPHKNRVGHFTLPAAPPAPW